MGEIIVSIICTAYNHQKYIRKCLDGFIRQKTDFKYEVLVHDDASTDETASIIREYAELYPDIIKPIYQTENQYSKGIAVTRDIIFPRCKGEYIALCEGDDYWIDPDKLQKQINALSANPDCSMCIGKVKRITEDESTVLGFYPVLPLTNGVISSDYFLNTVLDAIYYQTSSYVFRTELYREYVEQTPEFVRICPVGDIAYLLYFGYRGNIYYCEDILSCYRTASPGSWSARIWNDQDKRNQHFKRMIRSIESFDRFTDGRYHAQCRRRIYRFSYITAESAGDYLKLLTAEDKQFLQQPLRSKVKILAGTFLNPLLRLYYKSTKNGLGKPNERL